MRRSAAVAAAVVACIALGGASGALPGERGDGITHLVIRLGQPIVSRGGTVMVLPRRAEGREPPPGRDEVTVDVDRTFSIVMFDYSTDWGLRFERSPSAPEGAGQGIRMTAVTVGSGNYRDDATGRVVDVEDVEDFCVSGPDSSVELSRSLYERTFEHLGHGVTCDRPAGARVCVPRAAD